MARVVQVGGFYVEVDDAPESPRGGHEKTSAAAQRVLKSADGLKESIAAVCHYVKNAFDEANQPDELQVKFGLKLGGEAGIPYVTKAAGEAVLEIQATWKNDD